MCYSTCLKLKLHIIIISSIIAKVIIESGDTNTSTCNKKHGIDLTFFCDKISFVRCVLSSH